ncbi:unnamed protein product [Lupinus luteus]|uniref:Oleosin n=1 Tax=Lupinus luteus TaxID=3873 RepID=A0AAV1XHM9_LUPLU
MRIQDENSIKGKVIGCKVFGFPLPGETNTQTLQNSDKRSCTKVATAVTAGSSLLILSALLLAGTIIGLAIVTPLFVIFSPVLVPAVITVALLSLGFLASGSFGVAAMTVLTCLYQYVAGEHPLGSDQFGTARHKLMNKAREIKDYGGGGSFSSS